MLRILSVLTVAAVAGFAALPAAAQERTRPMRVRSVGGQQPVFVFNADGEVERMTHYVWLAPGRVGIPAETLQRLGFRVSQSVDGRRLDVAVPGSNYVLSVQPSPRRYAREAPDTAELGYKFPTAWKYGNRWYVSVRAMKRAFPDLLAMAWDDATYTLTVQPTQKLEKIRLQESPSPPAPADDGTANR